VVVLASLVWWLSPEEASSRRTPRSIGLTLGRLSITLAIVTCMIAPWTMRNYLAFDRFVLLNTNAGYAFYWGNHPVHGTDFVSILPSQAYAILVPAHLKELDEAAMDQALLREGLSFVMHDPARYAQLSLSRVEDYFKFWPSPDSGGWSNLVRVLSFGVSLPLILCGLFLATTANPYSAQPSSRRGVAILCLFATTYCLVHLLSWALIRYRLPVDATLLPFAALAVVAVWDRLFHSETPFRKIVIPAPQS
jgi:hypothetical protein